MPPSRGDDRRGGGKPPRKPARKPPGAGHGRSSGRGDGRRGARPERPESDQKKARDAAPKQWGGVARKGAGRLGDAEGKRGASDEWRKAMKRGASAPEPVRSEPPAWAAEEWVDEGDVRDRARKAVARGSAPAPRDRRRVVEEADEGRRRPAPAHLVDELTKVVGPATAPRLGEKLHDAGRAFGRERYVDARQILVPLAKRAPAAPAVRELLGLTHYRLGKWKDAIKELEAFRSLTGSTEQHPVLADCYRALRMYDRVDELWDELRESSPSAELVTEGRIVVAGSLADRDRLPEAIALLEASLKKPKRLAEHHLRLRFALADLYERAGETPKARALFRRVADAAPDFPGVAQRLRALR